MFPKGIGPISVTIVACMFFCMEPAKDIEPLHHMFDINALARKYARQDASMLAELYKKDVII